MNSDVILPRLRHLLLALAAFTCLAALVELVLEEHTKELIQWLPFVLCGLGLVAVGVVWQRPQRRPLLALRVVMGLLLLGSLFGVYEHLAANLAFAQEIHASASVANLAWETLSGASPLLAPGILGLAAVLGLAATYAHPALDKGGTAQS